MGSSLALIFLGALVGVTAGFFLTWWFARNAPPLEPFFLRVFRMENKSARIDTRLMLHELHRRVDDINSKMQRMDRELKELQEITGAKGAYSQESDGLQSSTSVVGGESTEIEEGFAGELTEAYRYQDKIFSLYSQGYSSGEISTELNVSRGEVELVLSLKEKPSWVIGSDSEQQ